MTAKYTLLSWYYCRNHIKLVFLTLISMLLLQSREIRAQQLFFTANV